MILLVWVSCQGLPRSMGDGSVTSGATARGHSPSGTQVEEPRGTAAHSSPALPLHVAMTYAPVEVDFLQDLPFNSISQVTEPFSP